MIDYTKLQMTTAASSNKLFKEGSGVLHVPALPGAGYLLATTSVAHGFNTDNLIFQVGVNGTLFSGSFILPWLSGDGRVTLYASIDSINLIIYCVSEDASGFGEAAFDVNFFYRVLIP